MVSAHTKIPSSLSSGWATNRLLQRQWLADLHRFSHSTATINVSILQEDLTNIIYREAGFVRSYWCSYGENRLRGELWSTTSRRRIWLEDESLGCSLSSLGEMGRRWWKVCYTCCCKSRLLLPVCTWCVQFLPAVPCTSCNGGPFLLTRCFYRKGSTSFLLSCTSCDSNALYEAEVLAVHTAETKHLFSSAFPKAEGMC